jgi:hypothetical protein
MTAAETSVLVAGADGPSSVPESPAASSQQATINANGSCIEQQGSASAGALAVAPEHTEQHQAQAAVPINAVVEHRSPPASPPMMAVSTCRPPAVCPGSSLRHQPAEPGSRTAGAAPLQAPGGSSAVAAGRPAVAGFTTARGAKFEVSAAAYNRLNRLFAGEEDLFANAGTAGGSRQAASPLRSRQREFAPPVCQLAAGGKSAGAAGAEQHKGSRTVAHGNFHLAGTHDIEANLIVASPLTLTRCHTHAVQPRFASSSMRHRRY